MTTRNTSSGATEFVSDEGQIIGRVEPVLQQYGAAGSPADTWEAHATPLGNSHLSSIGQFVSQQNAIAAIERRLNGQRLKDPTR